MKYFKILFIVITTFFFTYSAEAQLSENFLTQFKALLEAEVKDIQGELISSDFDKELGDIWYYESKKSLDGFWDGELEVGRDWAGSYALLITGTGSDPKNVKLFEEIRKEVQKLKKDGYTLKDEKTNPEVIKKSYHLKCIEIYDKEDLKAEITMSDDNSIYMEIEIETIWNN